MTLRYDYAFPADLLRLLDSSDATLPGGALIGTIADLLQLVEERKKGDEKGDFSEFKKRVGMLLAGPACQSGALLILDLDQPTLEGALFANTEFGRGAATELWYRAASKDPPPWDTIRHLILRSFSQWVDANPYRQMLERSEEESEGDA